MWGKFLGPQRFFFLLIIIAATICMVSSASAGDANKPNAILTVQVAGAASASETPEPQVMRNPQLMPMLHHDVSPPWRDLPPGESRSGVKRVIPNTIILHPEANAGATFVDTVLQNWFGPFAMPGTDQ